MTGGRGTAREELNATLAQIFANRTDEEKAAFDVEPDPLEGVGSAASDFIAPTNQRIAEGITGTLGALDEAVGGAADFIKQGQDAFSRSPAGSFLGLDVGRQMDQRVAGPMGAAKMAEAARIARQQRTPLQPISKDMDDRDQEIVTVLNWWHCERGAGGCPELSVDGMFERYQAQTLLIRQWMDEVPEFEHLFNESVIVAVLAATLGDQFGPGLGFDRETIVNRILEAGDDQIREIEHWMRATEMISRSQVSMDDLQKGLEAGPVQAASFAGAYDLVLEQEGFLRSNVSISDLPVSDRIKALEALDPEFAKLQALDLGVTDPDALQNVGRIYNNIQGRPFVYAFDDDRMLATFEVDGAFEGEYVFDIRLDGPILNDPMHVIGAIIEAIWGAKHTLIRADELPGQQNLIGAALEFFGAGLVNPAAEIWDESNHAANWVLGEVGSRTWVNNKELELEAAYARQSEYQSSFNVSDEDLVVLAMSVLALEAPNPMIAARAALDAVENPEVREQLVSHLQESHDAFGKDVENFVDERSSLQKFVDERVMPIGMTVLEAWERVTQGNVIALTDFLGDLSQAPAAIVDMANESEFNLMEMAGAFVSVFEFNAADAYRGEGTFGDYASVPDEFKGFFNIVGSVVGDPGTWIFASGPMRQGWMKHLMSSPEGVTRWMNSARAQRQWLPQVRAYAGGFLNPTHEFAGNSPALMGLLGHTGISPKAMRELLYATSETQVDDIILREMISGDMIPAMTGTLKLRNTAMWVANMSKIGDANAHQGLKRLLGQLSSRRTWSMSPDRFMTDGIDLLVAMSVDGVTTPKVWQKHTEEFLRQMVSMDRTFARTQNSLALQKARAVRRGLASESREHGYRDLAAKESNDYRVVSARIAELEARREKLLAGTDVPPEIFQERYDEALSEWARLGTDESRIVRDHAARDLAYSEHSGIAAIDRELALLRDGDRVLAEATAERAAGLGDDTATQALHAELAALGPRYRHGIPGTPTYDDLSARTAEWVGRRATNQKEISRLVSLQKRLAAPQSNDNLRLYITGLMQDWGERLLTVTDDADSLVGFRKVLDADGNFVKIPHADLKGKFELDWEIITGPRVSSTRKEELNAMYATKLDADGVPMKDRHGEAVIDQEALRQWNQLTTVGDQTSVRLPVTPMELVAYANRPKGWGPDDWMKRFLHMDPARRTANRTWIMRSAAALVDETNKFLAFNVLSNPVTWFRSNLDEIFRDIFKSGFFGRPTAVEGAGTPARVAAEGAAGRVPGPLSRGQARLGESIRGAPGLIPGARKWFGRFRGRDVSDAARRHQSVMGQPVAGKSGGAGLVSRSKAVADSADNIVYNQAEFQEAANQFLNGVLRNRGVWKKWAEARAAGDDLIFRNWWFDEGGRLTVGPKTSPAGSNFAGGMTWEEAMETADNSIDVLLSQIADPKLRGETRKIIQNAWADGTQIPDAVLRRFTFMPGNRISSKGVFNPAFDILYDRPSDVHGGLVFADYFEGAVVTLRTRHQGQGKYLDGERLANILPHTGPVTDAQILAANRMLNQGSPLIDDLVRQGGYRTEKMIRVSASRIAKAHADHLAYVMGAQSLLGKRGGQLSVFLRAQLDFMGFYGRELTNGMALGLNPLAAKIPGLRGLSGKVFETSFPLNLRLAGRVMDVYGGLQVTFDGEDPADAGYIDIFQKVLDTATFFPAEPTFEAFAYQATPSAAPFFGTFLHMLPLEHDGTPFGDIMANARDVLEVLDPTFAFNDEQVPLPLSITGILGFLSELVGATFAESQKSVYHSGTTTTQYGANALFSGTALTDFINSEFATPPGFNSALRVNLAQGVAADPLRHIDPNDSEYRDWVEGIVQQTYKDATLGEMTKLGFNMVGGGFLFDADDQQHLQLYANWYESGAIEALHNEGRIGSEAFDTITNGWAAFMDGSIDYEGADLVSDRLGDILYEELDDTEQALLILRYPEIVGNFISQWKCVASKAPQGVCQGDRYIVRGHLEQRQEGKDDGWLIRRDPFDFDHGTGMVEAMLVRYSRAAKHLREQIWREATTTDLRPDGISWQHTDPFGGTVAEPVTIGDLGRVALPLLGIDPDQEWSRLTLNQALEDLKIDTNQGAAPWTGSNILDSFSIESRFKVDVLRELASELDLDFSDPTNLPEKFRRTFRDKIILPALINKEISFSQYEEELLRDWGDPFWEAIVPLPLSEVPEGATENTLRITVNPAFVETVDGDTLAVEFFTAEQLVAFAAADVTGDELEPEAVQRVRLMGVNAEEKNRVIHQQWIEAADAARVAGEPPPPPPDFLLHEEILRQAIEGAETVDFVMFRELGGIELPVDQKIEGNTRWIMWLYIDGDVRYDPDVFSDVNPTGASTGGPGLPPLGGE